MFSCEFSEIFKNFSFIEHLRVAASICTLKYIEIKKTLTTKRSVSNVCTVFIWYTSIEFYFRRHYINSVKSKRFRQVKFNRRKEIFPA